LLLFSSEFENLILGLPIALREIHVSFALPSYLAQTNMNCISKLHATIIFWVGTLFIPIHGIWFSIDTQAYTYVPLITSIQFYMKNNKHQTSIF